MLATMHRESKYCMGQFFLCGFVERWITARMLDSRWTDYGDIDDEAYSSNCGSAESHGSTVDDVHRNSDGDDSDEHNRVGLLPKSYQPQMGALEGFVSLQDQIKVARP